MPIDSVPEKQAFRKELEQRFASQLANDPDYLDRLNLCPSVSGIIGQKPQTMAQGRCAGTGPEYYRIGKSIRYTRFDCYWWREQRRRSSTSDPGPGGADGGLRLVS